MPVCRTCGASAPDEAKFCPTCGNPFAPPAPPPAEPSGWASQPVPPTYAPPGPQPFPGSPSPGAPAPGPALPQGGRPLGVILLSIMGFLFGALLVFVGLALAAMGPTVVASPEFAEALADLPPELAEADLAAILVVAGVVAAAFGLLYLAVGYGMYQGRGWSWYLGLVLAGLAALAGLATLLLGDPGGLVNLLVAGFILWYLTRDGVKRWFGIAQEPQVGLPGYVPPPPGGPF